MDDPRTDKHSEDDDQVPDELDHDGEVVDETQPRHRNKVRRRVRVRKKIRIRKKPSVKKKLKKYAERTLWTLVIVGFIVALIVMVMELDIRDEKLKQKKKKASPSRSSSF